MKIEKTANELTEFATGICIDPVEFKKLLDNAEVIELTNGCIDNDPRPIRK